MMFGSCKTVISNFGINANSVYYTTFGSLVVLVLGDE